MNRRPDEEPGGSHRASLRCVRAAQLCGADIGFQVLVQITGDKRSGPIVLGGILSDIEMHQIGTALAHLAMHQDGEVCIRAATARNRRVVVYAGGTTLFLEPDQPVVVTN